MRFPIEKYIPELAELCKEYGVVKLEIFGSACTDDFVPERSDVDFLVYFPPGYDFGLWLSQIENLESSISRVIGQRVDLVMPSALRNKWFFREAEKTRKVIFDASEIANVA